MKRHPIGTTGLEVTSLGFGTAALGGMPDTYGHDVDEATARTTIHAIFDSPVNLIDTSRNYGLGRSENRIGTVIRERGGLPDGFVISTKLDRNMDNGRFDADQVRRSAEESLEALGIDRFQILHLHDPEHGRDLDEIRRTGGALDALMQLKEEGLVDAVGIAMGRTDILMSLLKDWPFDLLLSHNRFTLLNRSANAAFAYAHENGIAIFNAAPFAGGVLAKGSAAVKRITYQKVDENALAPVRFIEGICSSRGLAPGNVALQFSMTDPRIASTIVGVSRPERVQQALDWAKTGLSEVIWSDLSTLEIDWQDPEVNRSYVPG
jgi:D-threo-aldose 1-dehydrogenase